MTVQGNGRVTLVLTLSTVFHWNYTHIIKLAVQESCIFMFNIVSNWVCSRNPENDLFLSHYVWSTETLGRKLLQCVFVNGDSQVRGNT